ncbi:MAG: hypothetical protein ACI9VR_000718 [Cognaticolwellia sp.]|jgi:hypothetical protein
MKGPAMKGPAMSALERLPTRLGWELELMAPAGATRLDLAQALAVQLGASVHRIWLPQSEPSLVPNQPVFENLTLGFELRDAQGDWLLRCVDDLTLQGGLDRKARPVAGWYRIVSDDLRLLHLIARHCDAEAPLEHVLEPVAEIFGSQVTQGPGGMRRIADPNDLPIAIGAPLPGERHRPCEVVSAPLGAARSRELLGLVCAQAQALGFTVPAESATHLHLDASLIQDARVVANLVALWQRWGERIKQQVQTNPRCVRLGPFEDAVLDVVRQPDFVGLDWEAAQERLKKARPSKYRDINLRNAVFPFLGKPTVEMRVLPTSLDAEQVWQGLEAMGAVVEMARQGRIPESQGELDGALGF